MANLNLSQFAKTKKLKNGNYLPLIRKEFLCKNEDLELEECETEKEAQEKILQFFQDLLKIVEF